MTRASRSDVYLCAALAALVLVSAGCTRGADEARLHADLQDKLNRDVKQGLLEVVGVRREGSAPAAPAPSGAERVVVYFNATLRLAEDYAFGGWDHLSAASLAYALGANEKGLFGLKGENRTGDLVRAHGSAVYERSGDDWVLGLAEPAAAAAAAPNIEGSAPPSRSKQLIDQLAAMVELPPPGVPPQKDVIIAEELARASENIERRVRRSEEMFTLATGPADGDYARFGNAFTTAVNEVAPHVKLRQRHTEGSVDNVWLLARGEADYAVIQADVAAAALGGDGPFARGGPVDELRAVGGLFAEAIHVVVLKDSPIREVAQLRGTRVAIGLPASGTRAGALAVLAAHDLRVDALAEAAEGPLDAALARLIGGKLEAVFVTGAAPVPALQRLAVTPGLRLLSIDAAAIDRLVADRPGLARITLPANTYPQQRGAVTTAATTALLVTTRDAPRDQVARVAALLTERLSQQPTGRRADIARVAATREPRGLTIPLHPGAVRDPQ
jgi:TRAP transporter TAXI family solute receptor